MRCTRCWQTTRAPPPDLRNPTVTRLACTAQPLPATEAAALPAAVTAASCPQLAALLRAPTACSLQPYVSPACNPIHPSLQPHVSPTRHPTCFQACLIRLRIALPRRRRPAPHAHGRSDARRPRARDSSRNGLARRRYACPYRRTYYVSRSICSY